MGSQQFCLKWNNHQSNLLNVFDQLLQNEAFVDVTLACEGLSLKAHKMVLSACSPYFQTLFLENPCKHPIVILNSVRYSELKAIVDFMYKGEVNVSQEQLSLLLKTAEMLKVKGLAEVTNQTAQSLNANASDPILSVPSVSPPPSQLLSNHNHRRNGSPPPKRKKVRANPSSSAASSPQSNTLTNYNASKNSTDQAMMALDQSNDSHLPLESKICKEENTDQCMMDLPPKLIMEPAAELVDDQSSMSNITSDMPSYDLTKGDTSVPDLSSPPDITSSNIQSIPSTSGLQGANQDEENLPSVYIPLDDPRKNFAVAKCSMNAMINIKVEETATDSSAALQALTTCQPQIYRQTTIRDQDNDQMQNAENSPLRHIYAPDFSGTFCTDFKLVQGKYRGSKLLSYKGFKFYRNRENKGVVYWFCTRFQQTNKCNGRVNVLFDKIIKATPHNHPPDCSDAEDDYPIDQAHLSCLGCQ